MPRNPDLVSKSVYITKELEARLTKLAARERRSFSSQVAIILDEWTKKKERNLSIASRGEAAENAS
jgi:hypothetical protein